MIDLVSLLTVFLQLGMMTNGVEGAFIYYDYSSSDFSSYHDAVCSSR
jgi:hypothetical protein